MEYLAGDLADFTLGKKVVDLAISKFGRLDGLIINHGVLNPVKRISETDAEEWRCAFDINVFSAIAMVCVYRFHQIKFQSRHDPRLKQRFPRSEELKAISSSLPPEQQLVLTRPGALMVLPKLF